MRRLLLSGACAVGLVACERGNTGPRSAADAAPGTQRTAKTAALETGAALLQSKAPIAKISMYLNGFHTAKNNPQMQMEAHHYCNQLNEDFAQCVLFDGNTDDARLMGIEYIVSAHLYESLPPTEKAYWHPHNFEILSGQLKMPGLPDVAEKEALKGKMNSYGKTWHTWMTGMYGHPGDALPLGPPSLQWSFNHDGEDAPRMIQARDVRMHLDTAKTRKDREDLIPLANPQGGVDAMAGRFAAAKPAMPGIADTGDTSIRAVPFFTMKMVEATP